MSRRRFYADRGTLTSEVRARTTKHSNIFALKRYPLDRGRRPMSEAHATTVYVRILNEDVEVWRPVAAEHLGGDLYRLIEAAPNDEQWQFGKNDVVRCERRQRTDGIAEDLLVAADFASHAPANQAIQIRRIPTDQRNLTKVRLELDATEWHGYGSETLWAERVGDGRYRVRNIPFYALTCQP